MPIVLLLVLVMVIAFAIYAWWDWFMSLCGLILLMAVIDHEQMPKNFADIQGLSPWNALLFLVFVAWLAARRREGLTWDMPPGMMWPLIAFVLLIIVSYARAAMDVRSFPAEFPINTLGLMSEYLINPLKYMLPALMLYDGCRTRPRMAMALTCVLMVGVGYSLLVIKYVPLATLADERGPMWSKRLVRDAGMHANDMAVMLGGFFWALLASVCAWERRIVRLMAGAAAAPAFLAMVLCHSRAGYVAIGVMGIVFGLVRWRWLLVVLPVLAIVVCLVFPSIPVRLAMGFGEVDAAGGDTENWDEVTSGRTTGLWPPVIEQVSHSPLVGYGTLAIWRTETYAKITAGEGFCPNHPHNAYLEVLLNAGVVGLIIVLVPYGGLLVFSTRLGRDTRDPLLNAVGGAALASIGALLVGGLSGQSLFPGVPTLAMSCFSGIVARAWVDSRRACAQRHPSPRRAKEGIA